MDFPQPKITKEKAAAIYKGACTANTFRLLQLLSGEDDDPIECTLDIVGFEEKPEYEALSYRWGDLQGHSVQCNDQTLPVNFGLFYALQRFRLSKESRLLWVDEICINQDDEQDRIQELQKVHRIYADARCVLIWLGPGSEDSDEAMTFFPRMMSHMANKRSKQEITDPDLPSMNNAAYRTPKMIALNNLFSRPWFMRVWTIQEATFAARAVVVCGRKELSFTLFEDFISKCEEDETGIWADVLSSISSAKPADPRKPPRFVTAHIHGISKLKQVRSGRGPRQSVPTLLYRLRSCEATDARDRIYSMWSFLPDSYLQILEKPRYAREFTPADLFYQISKIELVHNQNLDYLGHAGLWQHGPDIVLPSWAADWSYRQLTHPLCVLDQDCLQKTNLKLYQASRDVPGSTTIAAVPATLTTTGKLLGEITKLASPFTFSTSRDENIGTHTTTSPIHGSVEENAVEKDFEAKVTQLQRQLEYPIRMFNETVTQIAHCFTIATQCHPYPQNLDTRIASMHTLTASLTHRGSGPALGATLVRVNDGELDELFAALDIAVTEMRSFNICGVDKKALKLIGLVREVTRTRRFFVTTDNYMGLAPNVAREGDRVAVIYGCSTPFLIRENDDLEAERRLVGECYVHGLMDGEAIKMDDVPVEEIRLI